MLYTKPIQTSINSTTENRTLYTVQDTDLTYTKCYRSSPPTDNVFTPSYFKSFNLPCDYSSMSSATTKPHLFQLNVENIVVCPLSKDYYSELIDGRTITMSVPQESGTGYSAKTIVSSTYMTLSKTEEDSVLGANIAFLFSDDINLPYKGTKHAGAISCASHTTWNTPQYLDRPAAVAFSELITSPGNDILSDSRSWSSVNLAVDVPSYYPLPTSMSANTHYKYDIPVGFVCLDKGFIVLTHPDIVDNIPWSSGTKVHLDSNDDVVIDGDNLVDQKTVNICFTGSTGHSISTLSYIDRNFAYKTNVVCLAMPGEFVLSLNDTWDYTTNYQTLASNSTNLDEIYVTEVGLYNSLGELLAVGKLDRPILKTYANVINFNLELNY